MEEIGGRINIAEGFEKNYTPKCSLARWQMQMADADGEAAETQVWLDYSRDCGYISADKWRSLVEGYEEVGRMLGGMIAHPERFKP